MNISNFYCRLLFVFLLSPLSACSENGKIPVNDLTNRIEILGNPYQARYGNWADVYARNIWDMKTYQGSIYLGVGNSSNYGPAKNAGPVQVIRYDPVTQAFIQEGVVDDEQIDVYHVFNGELYTPGHDARQSWAMGNFYQREHDGSWEKYRNIPGALHVYSMAWYKNKLFGALGIKGGAAVSISDDFGKSWAVSPIGASRTYGFLTVADVLYAVKRFPSIIEKQRQSEAERVASLPVYEFSQAGAFVPRADLGSKSLFPGVGFLPTQALKVVREAAFNEKSLYIGGYVHNDHQFLPFGVFVASSLEKNHVQVERLPIPKSYQPWDLLVNDGNLYVLAVTKEGDGFRNLVITAPISRLAVWKTLFSFKTYAFARSFEMQNGDFYFGLGCEVTDPKHWRQEELLPDAGTLLRIKNAKPER